MVVAFLASTGCAGSEEKAPAPACKEGLLSCDIGCVDPQVNSQHCGSCGNACDEGEECHEGSCVPLCTDGRTRCGSSCVNLESNSRHCGACGMSCSLGEHCVEGSCEPLICPEGQEVCGETCVDTRTDPQNCGVCGRACAEGDVCSLGHCSDRCDEGMEACAGGCFDLSQDRRHCGDCGRICSTGDVCSKGKCVRDCPEGRVDCAGVCVDTQSDVEHCGACHLPCKEGLSCVGGRCECPAGWLTCDGECVNPRSDENHCGGCGNRCRVDELANVTEAACVEGRCELRCADDFEVCSEDWTSGCNVDLMNAAQHCGECGKDCNVGAHLISGVCRVGECDILPGGCEPGWGDCDRQHATGCETDLSANIENCGSCGNRCLAHPSATGATCEQGVCILECAEGLGDCNGDPKDGCEHDVWTDPANCGACGFACAAGEICVDGSCSRDDEWPNWPLPPDELSAANYKVEGQVVTDLTTTLQWRKDVEPGTYNWSAALNRCGTHGAGWRLPTVIELLSIIKADASTPAIETSVFEGTATTASAPFWSSTPSHKTPNNAWSVNFASGETQVSTPSTSMQVRCVRAGEVVPGERRLVVYENDNNGQSLIHDKKTGLLWWGHTHGYKPKQADAVRDCGQLGVGDGPGGQNWGGFRLPTKRELESIVDRRRSDPAIEAAFFKGVGAGQRFWTATPVHGGANQVWVVDFASGVSVKASATSDYAFRCVKDYEGED